MLAVFDQIEQASAAVSAIIARGLVPAAMEMIDQLTIQAVEDAFGCGYPRDAAAALLIELDGLAAGLDAQAERIVAACRDSGAREVRAAADEAERQLLWKGRKSAFGAYGRISPAYMVMDGVIPRTRLPLRAAPRERDRRRARTARGQRVPRRRRQSAPEHPLRSAQARRGGAGGGGRRRDHEGVRGGRRLDLRRARHRAGEGRLHAVHLLRGRPGVHAAAEERVQPHRAVQSGQGVSHEEVVRGSRAPSPTGRTRSKSGASPSASERGRYVGGWPRCSTSSTPPSVPPTF